MVAARHLREGLAAVAPCARLPCHAFGGTDALPLATRAIRSDVRLLLLLLGTPLPAPCSLCLRWNVRTTGARTLDGDSNSRTSPFAPPGDCCCCINALPVPALGMRGLSWSSLPVVMLRVRLGVECASLTPSVSAVPPPPILSITAVTTGYACVRVLLC